MLAGVCGPRKLRETVLKIAAPHGDWLLAAPPCACTVEELVRALAADGDCDGATLERVRRALSGRVVEAAAAPAAAAPVLEILASEFGVPPAEAVAVQRKPAARRAPAARQVPAASVTQQLLKGVRMSYNLQNVTQARRGWEDATLRTEKARQDILSEVARAYWAWVYAFQQQEISEDAVVVAAEALRVGELKVEWGELAPVEKTRLQAAHVQAKSSALEANNAARETRDALLLLMGRAPGAELLPATPVGTVRDLAIDPARAVEVAQAQNVDLILAQRALEQAELDEINARHGMLPNLSATVATGSTSQVRFADGVGEEDTDDVPSDALTDLFTEPLPFVRVSGVLTVPLGNRAARTEREVAAFNVQIRRAELEEAKRSIESQVRSQVAVLTSARQRVDLADLNQRLAEETLSAEEALSEAGRTIQKDVLEARTEVSRTRAEAVKARTDYRMAYVELLKLQGQVSDDASEL